MGILNNYYNDKIPFKKIDKIFCILEGKDELSFIKKVYELDNNLISCENFIKNKIRLSWGRTPIQWRDKDKCNFQGGNIKNCKVPQPVIESLKNKYIFNYKAILIMFDKDCDRDNLVSIKSKQILKNYGNKFIFISNPCFEKVGIDFILTNEIKEYIDNNYQITDDSKCRWYKNNFANLPKSTLPPQKKRFKRVQSLEKLINYLKIEDIEDESIELKNCISFIKSNFESEN